jgi:hypothetical protein
MHLRARKLLTPIQASLGDPAAKSGNGSKLQENAKANPKLISSQVGRPFKSRELLWEEEERRVTQRLKAAGFTDEELAPCIASWKAVGFVLGRGAHGSSHKPESVLTEAPPVVVLNEEEIRTIIAADAKQLAPTTEWTAFNQSNALKQQSSIVSSLHKLGPHVVGEKFRLALTSEKIPGIENVLARARAQIASQVLFSDEKYALMGKERSSKVINFDHRQPVANSKGHCDDVCSLYGDGETGAVPIKGKLTGVSRKGFLVQQGSGVRLLTTNAVHCEPTTGAPPAFGGALVIYWAKKFKGRKKDEHEDSLRYPRVDGSTLIMGPIAAGHRQVMVMKRPDTGYEAAGLSADHNCYVLRAWHRTENAPPFTDSSTTVEDVATSVDEAVALLRDKVLPTALTLAQDGAATFSDADGESQLVLLEHEPFAGPLVEDVMDQMKKKKSRKRKREAEMTPEEEEKAKAEKKAKVSYAHTLVCTARAVLITVCSLPYAARGATSASAPTPNASTGGRRASARTAGRATAGTGG